MPQKPFKFLYLLLFIFIIFALTACRNGELVNDLSDQNSDEVTVSEEEELLEEVEVGVVDWQRLKAAHPQIEILDELREQIEIETLNLEEQFNVLSLVEENSELHIKSIEQLIEKRTGEIESKYQRKIEAKVEKLEKDFKAFREQMNEEISESLLSKKRGLEKSISNELQSKEEEQSQEFKKFRQALNSEYNHRIFNLKMRLRNLDLADDIRKEYQEELKAIENKKEEKIEQKKSSLEQELAKLKESKAEELAQKLNSYSQELMSEKEEKLLLKQEKQEQELEEYIYQQQLALQVEVSHKEAELEGRIKRMVIQAEEELGSHIKSRNQELNNNLNELKDSKLKLKNSIEDDIKTRIDRIADDKGLKVVLKDYHSELLAIDITEEVLASFNELDG